MGYMNRIMKSSQTVFLLGAGASKGAEIPTTFEFVDKFLEYISDRAIINENSSEQEKAVVILQSAVIYISYSYMLRGV